MRSDEGELMSSVFVDEDAGNGAPLRSKSNPFLDVPHDKKASEVKDGILQRKLHADIDGKRSEWDERCHHGCFFPFDICLINVETS